MVPELSEPVEYGLNIRHFEFDDFIPLVIVCALSLLLIVIWLIRVLRYLETRNSIRSNQSLRMLEQTKKPKSGDQNCRKQRLLTSDTAQLGSFIFMHRKTPEFSEKSLLSKAGKHPDFQVTLCL